MRNFVRTKPFVFAAMGLFLAGCATSALDQLGDAHPTGSAFNQALFQNYSILARSFGGTSAGDDGDFFNFDIFGDDDPLQSLAEAFADKALLAAGDGDVEPEPAPNEEAQQLRTRLLTALAATRDSFPRTAARSQADYDCWILNASVAAQADASATCRSALMSDLARLERAAHPVGALPMAAPLPAPVQTSDYTIYFEFDSWTLTAEDLAVLTQAVETAREGGQSRITIVGHTDTAGDAAYNQKLSLRRARVAKEAMIDMGARRAAIDVSGSGESDLAVQTADGVREAKNRRDVITLIP